MTDFFDRAGGLCSDCGEPVGRVWPVVKTCKTCLTELDRERISRQGGPVGRDEIVRMVQAAVANAAEDVRPYFTDEGIWEDIVAAADGDSQQMAQVLIDAIIGRLTEHSAAAREDRADAFGQDPTRRATSWAGRYDGAY